MKAQLRNRVAALFLLTPCAATTLLSVPPAALAQAASAEVRSLHINSDAGLGPGSRLSFTVRGTPEAQATIRVDGVDETIALKETARGVYVGRYTLKRTDIVTEDNPVHATLRMGNRTQTAVYTFPAGIADTRAASVPPTIVPPPSALRIERFAMGPVDRIDAGTELSFLLQGLPGAQATVELPGVTVLTLRELRPGHYEGSYTVRRNDNMNPSGTIVATLRSGERFVTAALAQPQVPVADRNPPVVAEIVPRDGAVVLSRPDTRVSAVFDDQGGSGVDPASVRIVLSGRNVTPQSEIKAGSFVFRGTLPPGRHTVDVSARDRAGNLAHRAWSFDVAGPMPIDVPITIFNHSHNGVVDGRSTYVVARTAPFATVRIRVDALPPSRLTVVAREIYTQVLQADAGGNFSFGFSPPFLVPGTRYEVSLVAKKADVTTEARLVLYQRQG